MSRRFAISARNPEAAAIAAAADVLRGGGVVAYATDTLYGLAADPRRDDAVERLFAAKGRPATSALPLVAANMAQAEEVGEFGAIERQLCALFWPGPLSLVVPAREALSRRTLAGGTSVAVRVPDSRVATALAAAHGFSITATSANLTGADAPSSAHDLDASLLARIDLVLDSGAAPGGPPSTIVRVENGRPVLLRAGAVPWERVLRSVR